MAATAAAAVASSFSSSINTLKCIRSNIFPSDHLHLRISSPTRLLASQSSHSFTTLEPLSIGAAALQKWRVLKITAALAQEEVAVTAEVGETEVVEEEEEDQGQQEKGEEVVQSAAEAGGEEVSAVSTKLYFGNLPYSVDSAQLAGIIQDYANPEMVEVSDEYSVAKHFFCFLVWFLYEFIN